LKTFAALDKTFEKLNIDLRNKLPGSRNMFHYAILILKKDFENGVEYNFHTIVKLRAQ